MANNDILRRIRDALGLDAVTMIRIFKEAGREVGLSAIDAFLKTEAEAFGTGSRHSNISFSGMEKLMMYFLLSFPIMLTTKRNILGLSMMPLMNTLARELKKDANR